MNTENINQNSADERNMLTFWGGFIPFAERFQKSYARLKTVPDLDESTGEMVLRGVLHEMSLDMTDAANYLHEQLPVLENPGSIVGVVPGERKHNAENMLAFFEQHLEFAREMQRMFGVESGSDNDYTRQLERAVELSKGHIKNNGNAVNTGLIVMYPPLKFNLIRDHKDVSPPAKLGLGRTARQPLMPERRISGTRLSNWTHPDEGAGANEGTKDSRRTTAKKGRFIDLTSPENSAE